MIEAQSYGTTSTSSFLQKTIRARRAGAYREAGWALRVAERFATHILEGGYDLAALAASAAAHVAALMRG